MLEIRYMQKGIKLGSPKDLGKTGAKPVWIDATDITKEESALLKERFSFHSLTAEDLLQQNTRVKVEEFPEYLFAVFYGVSKKKKIETFELDFILGNNFLITNHKKKEDGFVELKKNNERLEGLFSKGLDFLFHKLLDEEIDNFFPILEELDNIIEQIEEDVTKSPKRDLLTKILQTKRSIVGVKRIALAQREKIGFLAKNEYTHISNKAIPYFRDVYDHTIRVSDTVDNYREAIGNTFDAYMSSVSNNMNEVMKVLSIIATIALPLTVISGIYGTNFTPLPGSTSAYGFWVMILAMIILMISMLLYFKRKKWF